MLHVHVRTWSIRMYRHMYIQNACRTDILCQSSVLTIHSDLHQIDGDRGRGGGMVLRPFLLELLSLSLLVLNVQHGSQELPELGALLLAGR